MANQNEAAGRAYSEETPGVGAQPTAIHSVVDRDFREARAASEQATSLLRLSSVDILSLLKDAYALGFVAGLRQERARFGDEPAPVADNTYGYFVEGRQWWDVNGERLSDDDLRLWVRTHLDAFSDTSGGIVAYHARAYANRRLAIAAFMRRLSW